MDGYVPLGGRTEAAVFACGMWLLVTLVSSALCVTSGLSQELLTHL